MKHLIRPVILAAGLAFAAGVANAQNIPIAVVGPLTGSNAAIGEQMKRGAEMAVADINAKGGVLGKKLELIVADDACDPKQAVAAANDVVGKKVGLCRRALLLVLVDPGLGGLQRGGRAADHAGLDQPGLDRRRGEEGLEQRLPGLRPRRCAGRGRRQVSRRPLQGKAGRDRPRQDRLRQRPRRRDQEGDERRRPQGDDVRGDHPGRQGLLGADQQDEAGEHRCDLFRRLPDRGRADRPPGARPGLEGAR